IHLVASGASGALEAAIRDNYAIERGIWPRTDKALRGAVMLIEPPTRRNLTALGFDVFSEDRRRAALERAIETGAPTATRPLTLVVETGQDQQRGFIVFQPVSADPGGTADGFVYGAFRAGDLHAAALSGATLPVELK